MYCYYASFFCLGAEVLCSLFQQLSPATLNQYQALLSQGPLPLNSAYQLLQLHFHWGGEDSRGSEHTIDGAEFPLELHLVHKRKDLNVSEALATPDGLAVAGFFFEIDVGEHFFETYQRTFLLSRLFSIIPG